MNTNKSVIDLQQDEEKMLRAMQELQRAGVASTTDERWVKASDELRKIGEEMEFAIEAEKIEKRLLGIQAESEKNAQAKTGAVESARQTNERDMSYEGVFKRFLTMRQHGQLPPDEQRLLETRGTNTQITATNSLGGFLVPQSFSNELEMYGIFSGGMMEACRVYADPIGGTLKWPTGDDTATVGEITAGGVARTVQDLTFGNVTFSDYTVDSGIVKVGRELINDERVGLLQSMLAELLAQRISRKANSILTNGTGTSEPYGLTVAVTASGITSAGATAITKSELTRLLYSVNRYYHSGAKTAWMMHSSTLGYLRTLDFSTDTTHIFADLKIAGEPDMLLGYPVIINNDLEPMVNGLPVTAKKHVYFGDFSKYVIRRIDGVSIERNDSVYWDKFTAGFMGWMRLDGNLITQGAIKPLLQT